MYPDLHMPFAPSWSLHWAYRDGHLVNLPVSLLVEGDIIALRPGQESFASLRGIKVALGPPPALRAHREPKSGSQEGGLSLGQGCLFSGNPAFPQYTATSDQRVFALTVVSKFYPLDPIKSPESARSDP